MGYLEKAISGFSAQTVIKVLGNGLVLVKMMVLARLLGPTEFGIFSLVTIALGISESITQTGVNLTILQSKHSVQYFLNTAWVIAICRGFIISLIMILLGWAMQGFFNQPELFFLVSIASLVPAIKGFINPSIIELHKSLSFWSDALYRFSLMAAETLLAIGLVWWGKSVEVWILSLVGAALFEVVISFYFFKHRPRFEFLASRAEIIFKNAQWLSLSSVLSYLNENLDNVIVGKVVGTFGLGLYQNSYAICHELNFEVTKSIHHGTLPIYTRLVREADRLRRAVMRTQFVGMTLVTLLSIPVLIAPGFFVTTIFGDKWIAIIPIMRTMILAGLIHSFSMLCYSVLLAKSQLKPMNWHLLMTLILMLVTMPWLGTQYGLSGAVWSLVIARSLPVVFLLWVVRQSLWSAEKK